MPICLGILAVVTLLNLRGLADAARAFLLPTMLFIVGLLVIIAIGLIHPLALHAPQPGRSLVPAHALETVSVLLVLKAFSAGCSALTGVEAIANGVPLFKQPRVPRAKRTELLLGVILGAMLLGLAVLADRWHIGPRSGQTVLSQIMATAVGRHWAYYMMSLTITLVLALAANTSFGGMPMLASLLARDDYLPHLFALRDDRQVFASGIWTLAILSAALLIAVDGNTLRLIPLFAIGVFTGFTLSQAGMVVHWWRSRPHGWQRRAAINGIGAAATAVATVVFLVTKFTDGAWVVVLAVPALIVLFTRIHRYYQRAGHALGRGTIPGPPQAKPVIVVVPVTEVSLLTRHAISEALSISQHVIAVTVAAADPDQSTGHTDRPAPRVGPLEPGGTPAGTGHPVRLDRRPRRGVHRRAPQAPRRADPRTDPRRAPRPAALPPPAQPPRCRPHHGAADPHRHGRGPRRHAAAAPRRRNRPEPPLAGAKPARTGLAAAATPARSAASALAAQPSDAGTRKLARRRRVKVRAPLSTASKVLPLTAHTCRPARVSQ